MAGPGGGGTGGGSEGEREAGRGSGRRARRPAAHLGGALLGGGEGGPGTGDHPGELEDLLGEGLHADDAEGPGVVREVPGELVQGQERPGADPVVHGHGTEGQPGEAARGGAREAQGRAGRVRLGVGAGAVEFPDEPPRAHLGHHGPLLGVQRGPARTA